METKGESLPSPISSGSSGKKSSRKEEQYRLMFSELEKYVVAHSSNSSKHYSVLECLMQVIVGGWYTVHVTVLTDCLTWPGEEQADASEERGGE